MRILEALERLSGDWQGRNLLWLAEEPLESETTATVRTAAGGTCLCIEYAWHYEGDPQEGLLLFGSQGAETMRGVWRDSFHSSAEFLVSDGKAEGAGAVTVLGAYAAPDGPDWGWRTQLQADGNDRFAIEMVNIAPDGQETPAVRMVFVRKREV